MVEVHDPMAGAQHAPFGDVVARMNGHQPPALDRPHPFKHIWSLEFRKLIPIIPPGAPISLRSSLTKRLQAGHDDRGKVPGIRHADGSWSGFDWLKHETQAADLDRWAAMGAGVGVKTGDLGDGSTLVLIDADTLDEDRAKVIRDHVEAAFGKLPLRIGRAPKAGYLARVSGPFTYSRIEFGDSDERGQLRERVEILSDGRQFVAHGVHPATRQPYRWPTGMPPLSTVPIVQADALVSLLEDLRPLLPAASPVRREGGGAAVDQQLLECKDAEKIRAAVAALPNTSKLFPTRETWLAVGYKIKAAMGEKREAEALELFQDWSAKWTDPPSVDGKPFGNAPGYVAAEFARCKPPFRSGATALFRLAVKHSAGAFTNVDAWWDQTEADKAIALSAAAPQLPGQSGSFSNVEPADIFGHAGPAELGAPPPGSLPPVLEQWVGTEARRKGVPKAFAAAGGVGAMAAAIGNSLRIRPRLRDTEWDEPAGFWICVVAPPGSAKSPIIKAALKPLHKLEGEFRIENAKQLDLWRKATAAAKRAKPGANGGPVPNAGPEPAERRVVLDNFTMEKAIRICAANPRGLVCAPDELVGALGGLGAYKKSSDGDRAMMLRLFDGDQVQSDRIGSGSTSAESALVSLIASTQPDKISKLTSDLSADGLLQRFLFVLHDGVERPEVDEEPDHEALAGYARVLRGLAVAEYLSPNPIMLTPEASAVLAECVKQIKGLRHLVGASAVFGGHAEKWGKFLPRLALVFHAVTMFEEHGAVDPTVRISAETARMAVKFSRFLLRHQLRFYEQYFSVPDAVTDARWIADFLLTRPQYTEVDRRTLYQANHEFRGEGVRRLLVAMAELENAGWVEAAGQKVNGPNRWVVNPAVHERFKEHAERARASREAKRANIEKAAGLRRLIDQDAKAVTAPRSTVSLFD